MSRPKWAAAVSSGRRSVPFVSCRHQLLQSAGSEHPRGCGGIGPPLLKAGAGLTGLDCRCGDVEVFGHKPSGMLTPVLTVDAGQGFSFDIERLAKISNDFSQQYSTANPFPHCIIDGLFPESTLNDVLQEYPGSGDLDWIRKDAETVSLKLATRDETQLGPKTRAFIHDLNSATFITALERITGIDGLIPDPYLTGGGLHQILRGGFAKVHADFNWHEKLKLDRRVNVLIYLNKDWKEEYGGHLELWDAIMKRCEARILPIFNRVVIFNTTDVHYHGHPDPLTCPPDVSRKSIALYYYSNGRPEAERSQPHSTLYRNRPGEIIWSIWKQRLVRFVPPVALDLARAISKRRKD